MRQLTSWPEAKPAFRRSAPAWLRDVSAWASLAAAIAAGLVVAGGLLLDVNLHRLTEARRLTAVTIGILDRARAVVTDIVTAETGQRGFLLTGEERYLEPYAEAMAGLWNDFDDLDRRVQVADQRERLQRLRPLLAAKLAELAQTIEWRRRSLNEALAVVRTDAGQRLMEQIRAEFEGFERSARSILAERSRAQERAARFTTSTALVCGALAFVAAAFGVLSVVRRRDDRRLEEQNLRLEREVEERTAALEETNAELEAFAATISHDLRAPVRAIGGYAAAIEEDAGDRLVGDERDYLARIAEAAERMDALIEDILGYSRLGRQQLSLAPVSLESAVNLELAERRKDAARTGAEVEVIRPLPAVRAHGGALGLAVGNLLDNALKFVRRGERAQVRIWAERRDSGAIRLWVEDRGIGVAPSNQERIFRPFERLHGREAYAGSGVGLAIVRRVAERMGGSCGVLSSPGVGSRFWIELPAADKVSGPAPGRSRP